MIDYINPNMSKLKVIALFLFLLSSYNISHAQIESTFEYALSLEKNLFPKCAIYNTQRITHDRQSYRIHESFVWKNSTYHNTNQCKYLYLEILTPRKKGIPESFKELGQLEFLTIDVKSYGAPLKFNFETGLQNLRFLVIRNTAFLELPEFIYNCQNLEFLSVYVSDDLAINFERLKELENLKFLEVINANDDGNASSQITIWTESMFELKSIEQISFWGHTGVTLDSSISRLTDLKVLNINFDSSSNYRDILEKNQILTDTLIFDIFN